MLKVIGYEGVGDNFYQRDFVKQLLERHGDIALFTPFPELYHDMPTLKFWFRNSMLRTQEKAQLAVDKSKWAPIHKRAAADITLGYDNDNFKNNLTIVESYETKVKLDRPYTIDFPLKDEWIEKADKIINKRKVCILRKPTLRNEYWNSSRNPKTGVMEHLVKEVLLKENYTIISVNDLDTNLERQVGNFYQHEDFDKGELNVWEIAALMRQAALVLSPVGFALPMCSAVNAKCFIVFGGSVKPELVYDKRMNLTRQSYIAPDPFCNCLRMDHDCRKEIDIDCAVSEFTQFIKV